MELLGFLSSGLGISLSLLGVLAACFYTYWKRLRTNHYWRQKNVPCDDPLPILGSFLEFVKGKTLFMMDNGFYKKYGRIYGSYEGPNPVLFVAEPELLRQIMVKDFHTFADRREFPTPNEVVNSFVSNLRGEDWHRVRSVVTPAFATGKLKKMVNLIMDCGESARKNFMRHAESGQPVNTKSVFGGYTLDVIASAAFATKLNSHEDPNNIFVQKAKKIFSIDWNWKVALFFLAPKLVTLLKLNVFEDDVTEFFADLSRSIVQRRKKNNEVHDDFLNNMMEAQKNSNEGKDITGRKDKESLHKARNEEDDATLDEDSNSYFKNYSKNKTISETELVAQCVIFFLAGYDTTATALTMIAYHMALNPKCQEKLVEEIDAVWKKHGTIDADALRDMKYSEALISETLRLSPPATRLERHALKDYPLGDTGIVIPKGMVVGIPIYSMHRDPDFFPDPEEFNPDRFLPENKDLIQQYTYMPFGAGPRNCLGMRLALMEIKLGLLQVFKDFTFATCPQTKVPLELLRGSGLYSPKDVTLKVLKRKK